MKQPMEEALQIAQQHLKEIRTVKEWAEVMGYPCSKDFSRRFRNHYQERPSKLLKTIKLKKAIQYLINTNKTIYEIGCCELGIGDEKAFWQYMKYHTGYSPRELKSLENSKLVKVLRKIKE